MSEQEIPAQAEAALTDAELEAQVGGGADDPSSLDAGAFSSHHCTDITNQ